MRKGIVLAGGSGTRLHPLTAALSKQLLPIYDKPMIFYPISVLMLAGVRDILIISTPRDIESYRRLLGSGEAWGVRFSYEIQPAPDGLAQAYIIGEEFIGGDPSVLILGDNIFHGHGLTELLDNAGARQDGATVFGYRVGDPERYGVVGFDADGRVSSLEEKPSRPKSNYAVVGLYFFDGRASEFAKSITPSARGELEITDLNRIYLEEGSLQVELLGRGYAWLDTGTTASLLEASEYVRTVEIRQGQKVCCPEEIAYRLGFIDRSGLLEQADRYHKSPYGAYLRGIAEEAHEDLVAPA